MLNGKSYEAIFEKSSGTFFAVKENHSEFNLELCLKAIIDVIDEVDSDGKTLLMYASMK